MVLRYSMALAVATCLVASSNESVLGFSIVPSEPGATFRYQPESSYRVGGIQGTTSIDTSVWFEPISLGGTPRFTNTLNFLWAPRATPPFGQGWNFQPAQQELEGNFEIVSYVACAYLEPCGGDTGVGENINPSTRGVGSLFSLRYNPAGADPRPGEDNNLHWIQVVESNQSPTSGPALLPFVDNKGRFDNPYYDQGDRFANESYFIDVPYFNAITKDNFFSADLYLVQEITPPGSDQRTVQIYNGVRWGWENKVTRPGYYTDSIGGGIGATLPGYTPNDDGSFGAYPLGFSLNYFGQTYNDFYINNNGNISFGNGASTYTPNSLNIESSAPMIAPYWADVDTRGTGTVSLRTDIPNQAIVTWDNVGYYNQHTDKTASFQLVLRGPDYPVPNGEGNIGFFYKDVQWETGDASGGSGGFGGTPADVGFGDGSSTVNSGEFSLSGSQQAGIGQLVTNNSYWFNLSCNGGSGGGGCSVSRVDSVATGDSSAITYRITDRELLTSDIDRGDTSQLTQSTPESNSTFASAIGSWFKSLGFQNGETKGCSARW